MIKKCVICGREFETERKNSVCCSDKCKRRRMNLKSKKHFVEHYKYKPLGKAVCVFCGQEFEKHSNNQKCCSKECTRKFRSKYRLELYHANKGEVKQHREEEPTYSKNREWTPALENFFTEFAKMLKGGV